MFFKTIAAFATMATTVMAVTGTVDPEQVTCGIPNATRSIITSIESADQFCTMLTGYGVYPVATNEGCAGVYCYGEVENGGLPMPPGYIVSSHYVRNDSAQYVQITGCIDSTVWAQNPTDEGGQMDSHGWAYTCAGYGKFLSLLEPATNTFCIRCCNGTTQAELNDNCDTSHSTSGCWNLIPGNYTFGNNVPCTPPAGAPNSTTIVTSGVPPSGSSTATGSGAAATGAAATGTGTAAGAGSTALPAARTSAAAGIFSTGSAIAASLALAVMIASF
ncbi:hypothetical protein EMPS_10544 [Entomortierella parvispora]|uniref:Secreted protein n=1 Tax=Entomortierella parvispora TaxID=205924 RepID=A0A9P3HKD7_9FUNG|nr:hypothetical protein EMPS_10544 [Entomortierella parvispora]